MLHLVGILFPRINDDARSKSHQILQRFVTYSGHCRKSTEKKTRCKILYSYCRPYSVQSLWRS